MSLVSLGTKVPCVAIKRGPRRAIGIWNGENALAPGFPVQAVDTTGQATALLLASSMSLKEVAPCQLIFGGHLRSTTDFFTFDLVEEAFRGLGLRVGAFLGALLPDRRRP